MRTDRNEIMGRSLDPRQLASAALFACAMIAGGCVRPARHPVFPAPPTPVQVYETWLAKNCNVGDDKDLERYLRQYSAQVTPRLIQAFVAGPPQDALSGVQSRAESQLVEIQRSMDSLHLPADDAARLQNLSPKDYSQAAVADYVRAYKSSALAGLGVIQTPEALARLNQELNSPDSEFYAIAKVILAKVKKPARTAAGEPPAKR